MGKSRWDALYCRKKHLIFQRYGPGQAVRLSACGVRSGGFALAFTDGS